MNYTSVSIDKISNYMLEPIPTICQYERFLYTSSKYPNYIFESEFSLVPIPLDRNYIMIKCWKSMDKLPDADCMQLSDEIQENTNILKSLHNTESTPKQILVVDEINIAMKLYNKQSGIVLRQQKEAEQNLQIKPVTKHKEYHTKWDEFGANLEQLKIPHQELANSNQENYEMYNSRLDNLSRIVDEYLEILKKL